MKKISLLLILFLTLASQQTYAQHGFCGCNHLTAIDYAR